ncbi:protein FAR1-RELATED SEQUENCE 5-like [Spinacia oleracea]|uniref:Protein FAR1-RELATED SEQUENCE 5-like n=1 Tax=Spinacia oleracea TaxID=3562 RepID=A0ABM3R3V4_SPIOL|nr:protein FAR1-RELATED SEQUENCE 5-like [Spinacia oleracea]
MVEFVGNDNEDVIEDVIEEVHITDDEEENGADDDVVSPPFVGMVFQSWEEVDTYYKRYGRQQGFGILRAAGSYVQKGGAKSKELRGYLWKCECYGRAVYRRRVEGKRVYSTRDELGTKRSKKCDCPVLMYCNRTKDGEWVVKRAVNEHKNHCPTPRKSRYVPRYRQEDITSLVKRKLFNDYNSGANVPQIFNCLASERNGVENVTFTKKDLQNIIARDKAEKMKEGDWNAMWKYFKAMSTDNENFFHKHRVGEDNILKDVMWVDARSRAAYEEFGDVVVFDSTYLTNEYDLPFSNFVGVNHHGQTILLGCALLSHEDSETFEWLFTEWLSCMSNKKPIGFLTDQDAAMRKALREVMPDVRHRWCLWHILTKFSHKLGKYNDYELFKVELHNVIYNSLTKNEFEVQWTDVIKKYKLEGEIWLAGLYHGREMWVPAFMNGMFWAGMKSTQRSESINRFFDGFVDKHTRLFEFAPFYIKAVESRANDEQQADAADQRAVRPLATQFSVERAFRKVYTDAKFLEVQEQCNRVLYLTSLETTMVSAEVAHHKLEDRVWVLCKETRKEFSTKYRRNYIVQFNLETKLAECECKLFESDGILCRHIIKVYDMHDTQDVPDVYILRRWRKDVSRKHSRVKVVYHDPSKTEDVMKHDKLMLAYEPISLKASTNPECIKIVMDTLKVLEKRLDQQLIGVEDMDADETQDDVGTPGLSQTNKKRATTPKSVTNGCSQTKNKRTTKSTPKSVNKRNKCATPPDNVKVNDHVARNKPHRTPSCRHRSCVEPKKKTPIRRRRSKTNDVAGCSQEPPTQGADDVELTHTSAGGIEMLSQDGSVGYFTSIVGGDDGLDIVGDVGDDGLGLDNVDDLLCRNSLGWDK